jgi:pimeloyl-ACP methyl ester carboxylesterase
VVSESARPRDNRRNVEQQIRFCRARDGATLAWASVGSGPALVKTANWLSHLEYDWRVPLWQPLLAKLSGGRTLVRYDQRGCGLSQRQQVEISLDAWVADLEAVVDAAGLARFSLLGISQGGRSRSPTPSAIRNE